jgi:fumarylacetoacetase
LRLRLIEYISPGSNQQEYSQVTSSNLRHTYYTAAQMLSHHTTSGCPMKAGDLLGTGTLSAPRSDGLGSLLEKSEMGRKPFQLRRNGESMTYLRDGDSVRIKGLAQGKGYRIGFGECEGRVLEAFPIAS